MNFEKITNKLCVDLHNALPRGPISQEVWMGRMRAVCNKWPELIKPVLTNVLASAASAAGISVTERDKGMIESQPPWAWIVGCQGNECSGQMVWHPDIGMFLCGVCGLKREFVPIQCDGPDMTSGKGKDAS